MAKAKKKVKKAAPKAAKKTAAPKAAAKKAKPAKAAPKKKAAAKGAKVIKLPMKKKAAAKPAPAKAAAPAGRHLQLVVDNAKTAKKKGDWSKLLTPLDDRVLVLVEDGERVTPGGLIIPDTASVEGNHRGVVVSVGAGHRDKKGRLRPLELRVGDQVLFNEYAGTEVRLENQNFKILRETDILGLVTK